MGEHIGGTVELVEPEESVEMQLRPLVGVVLGLILVVPVQLVRAWAIASLWNWYVAEVFGAPRLHLLHGFGLALISAVVMGFSRYNLKREHLSFSKWFWDYISGLIMTVVYPLTLLLMGWIVKGFLP